jgi:cell division protein FtsW (lipid II flippase)
VDGILDSVAGLPMHPLIVHGAVVLVPLAALGLMLMAVRPAFSRRFGVLVVIVAGAGAAASVAAKLSGEELAERVGTPEVHAELGDVMPWVALGLFVLGLVFWLVDRGIPGNKPRPGWLVAFAILLLLASAFAILWTIRVGHSGAEAVWSDVVESTDR